MRKIRWVTLLLLLVIILTISGCGSQATLSSNEGTLETQSNADTQSSTESNAQLEKKNTTQTQSEVDAQAVTAKDTTQTQSKTDAQAAAKDTTQTQSKADTQAAAKDTTQTQSKADAQAAAKDTTQTQSKADAQAAAKDTTQTQNNASIPPVINNPIVTIVMTSGDQIKVELYPSVAPNTVKSFISLAQKGFYDGLIFHRVIPGFMIQGGDPSGNGTGGPGYSIKGEFANNGFSNDLKHERGVISMGRTPDPNSAGSQFFIMVASASSLDENYAAFGRVISGMDAVDKIVNSQRDTMDKPLQNQEMKSVTVDTFGVNYGEPETSKK